MRPTAKCRLFQQEIFFRADNLDLWDAKLFRQGSYLCSVSIRLSQSLTVFLVSRVSVGLHNRTHFYFNDSVFLGLRQSLCVVSP